MKSVLESVKTWALVHKALNMKKNSKHKAQIRRANPIPDHVILRKYENNKPKPRIKKNDTSNDENSVGKSTEDGGKRFRSNGGGLCTGRDFEEEAKHEAC